VSREAFAVRVYGALVKLYPRQFRDEYDDDLAQAFRELVTERGAGAAWRRALIDLLVTVPLYRLETVMNRQASSKTLTLTIGLLGAGGFASLLVGIYPGVLLVVAAISLGIVRRSDLARAIRVPDPQLRRRRLLTASALAAVFVACYALFLAVIGESWNGRATVLALVGSISMIGSVVYLIAGLLTPRHPGANPTAG
jgi:hypothetical protein